MTGRRRLLLTATVVAAGGLLGVRPARASCAGPEVSINGRLTSLHSDQTPAPMSISRGTELVVTGRWFHHGCEDTVGYSGCSPVPDPPSDPQRPMQGVELTIGQGDRTWPLGTADASPRDQEYRIAWRTTFPTDCGTGPATLQVGPTVTIPIVLTR